ncbi:hypothetical protein CH75_06550 [Dyella jiangningensis]|nr:hypothetical protein CH75_06550 [Dyella jiangningensis]
MTQQYLRALSLIVGNQAQAYDLSNLHVRFEVKNATVQTLKTLQARVFNVTDELAKLIQNEFTSVRLSAGYEGNIAQIFSGEITMVRRGKESATDTFVDIQAQDGDKAFGWATSSWTIDKGYTADDIYQHCLKDLSQYGITAGFKPDFSNHPAPDAKTVHGQTRDVLRTLADSQGCTWSIEDGKLNFIPIKGYLPGTVPQINASSGMVGTPQQTIGGLVVRMLLNPVIKAGSKIQLNNADVASLTLTSKFQLPQVVPSFDADGFYRTFQVVHAGDSRGNTWYTDCVCAAVDGTAPLTSSFTQAVSENG